ncbi:hypothetical protein GALL_464520 [mine drainage metagenome]|uniref:Uncharacterized protein n=1 Tax=mine drainage metagenome TaxID=410659 RepID=A0A1J5Q394_9ZZZZ
MQLQCRHFVGKAGNPRARLRLLLQVTVDRGTARGIELAVDIGHQRVAVGSLHAHPALLWPSITRSAGRDAPSPAVRCQSWVRARDNRDMTVPVGTPIAFPASA